MNKVGKILTGVLMALGLLLGGLVSSAPAQARPDVTTAIAAEQVIKSVYYPYNGNLSGVPLVVNMQDGRTLYRYRDTVTDNVWRYCPPSINYFLVVENPDGHRVTRSRGTCHVPADVGQYKVWVKRVN